MNSEEKRVLQEHFAAFKNAVLENMDDLASTVEALCRPEATLDPRPENFPLHGRKVRVYATHAGDRTGTSLVGDLAVVVKGDDPTKPLTSGITVEMIEGSLKGLQFKVYPQQCLPADDEIPG